MNSQKVNSQKTITALTLLASFTFGTTVVAHDDHAEKKSHEGGGHHFEPAPPSKSKGPAAKYSGATAIDLSNGVPFDNGTYGLPNSDYEKWGQSANWAVSLAEMNYPYEQQTRFSNTLDERLSFYEAALWNWARVSEATKPEVKDYAEKASTEIKPRLEKARNAWSRARTVGKADWAQAQDEAKRAFIELQATYRGIHKNVR